MAKIFASTDTSVKTCPVCNSRLVPAEYYSAVKGGSQVVDSKTDWASGKTTNTVSTQYSDVQRCRGVYCMSCYYKKMAGRVVLFRILILVGLLGIIAFGVLSFALNNTALLLAAIPFLLALVFGWTNIRDNGVIGENPYSGLTKEQIEVHATKSNENIMNSNSSEFVACIPHDQIPQGRTFLSLSSFKK